MYFRQTYKPFIRLDTRLRFLDLRFCERDGRICVMCANDALINNRRVLHSSSAGDLVPYLPSSVRATLLVGRALPPRLVGW